MTVANVRVLIGDIDTPPILTDAQIQNALNINSNIYYAAALLADSLSVRFASQTSVSIDGLTVNGADIANHYAALADELRGLASGTGGGVSNWLNSPNLHGISLGTIYGFEIDSDRVPDRFSVGKDDF